MADHHTTLEPAREMDPCKNPVIQTFRAKFNEVRTKEVMGFPVAEIDVGWADCDRLRVAASSEFCERIVPAVARLSAVPLKAFLNATVAEVSRERWGPESPEGEKRDDAFAEAVMHSHGLRLAILRQQLLDRGRLAIPPREACCLAMGTFDEFQEVFSEEFEAIGRLHEACMAAVKILLPALAEADL